MLQLLMPLLLLLQASFATSDKVAAAAGLGLAVLAGLSRVPELGAATEVIEKVPLLLKVQQTSGACACFLDSGAIVL